MFLGVILKRRKEVEDFEKSLYDSDIDEEPEKLFGNKVMEKCFVLQLLNEFITEFDYEEFSAQDYALEGMYFRHLVERCPNIKKIAITDKLWDEDDHLPRIYYNDFFLQMTKWKNLTFLSIKHKGIDNLTHKSLRVIQKQFPKLRLNSLQYCIFFLFFFLMERILYKTRFFVTTGLKPCLKYVSVKF